MEKVSSEVAEIEFNRFVDAMDLQQDTRGLSDEDQTSAELQRSRVVFAIRRGSLVINDSGEPIFKTQRCDTAALTFHEPTGASLTAMSSNKKAGDMGKLFATMADITKTNAATFSKMKMADLKICMAITTLFLG